MFLGFFFPSLVVYLEQWFCLQGDIGQRLETCFVVTSGGGGGGVL